MGSMLMVSVGCLQRKYFGSVAGFLKSHFSTQILQTMTALTPRPICYRLCVVKFPHTWAVAEQGMRQGEEDSAPPHHLAEMGTMLAPAMMHNAPQLQCPVLHWGAVEKVLWRRLSQVPLLLLLQPWCSQGCSSHFLPHLSLPNSALSILSTFFQRRHWRH